MDDTFVKLFRKFEKWEWYTVPNTTKLFLHCLIKAYRFDTNYRGQLFKAGSFPTSIEKLSLENGLSVREVRTSLNHLKSTHELTIETSSKGTIITVNNYSQYQDGDKRNDTQATSERQSSDKVATTIKESKKDIKKESKNNTNTGNVFVKPSLSELEAYCQERENCIDAQSFIDFYDSNGWMVGKNKMKDWKASVRTWESRNGETIRKREMEKSDKIETPKAEVEEVGLEELENIIGKLGERYAEEI